LDLYYMTKSYLKLIF